jgi:hypothetical protein
VRNIRIVFISSPFSRKKVHSSGRRRLPRNSRGA